MLMVGSKIENAHSAKKPTTTRSSFSTRISLCSLFKYVRTRYECFWKNTNYVLWHCKFQKSKCCSWFFCWL